MKRQNPNKELLTACRDATLTQVQMHTLLQKKADINTRDSKHKDSALMVAIKSGSLKTCQILVQFKADVNFQNWHQFYVTPLHLAIKEDHYSIARFLLQSPEFTDPDILDRYNETPLHRSSRMNNALIVRQLIEARCDLDKQNRDTKATALHIAAQVHMNSA